MNHNYYYTLLGNKAGGTASTGSSACSAGKYLRFDYSDGNNVLWGMSTTQQEAAYRLAFGYSTQVFTNVDWANFGQNAQLYLDSGLQFPIHTGNGGLWFMIEGAIFFYDSNGGGVDNYIPASPTWISTALNTASATPCNLNGPYNTTVWVDSTDWQTVSRVWIDSARTQPLVGDNKWWSPDPTGPVAEMGTSLLIDDCGRVFGIFAC